MKSPFLPENQPDQGCGVACPMLHSSFASEIYYQCGKYGISNSILVSRNKLLQICHSGYKKTTALALPYNMHADTTCIVPL